MKLDFDSKELRVFDKEEIFKIHPLWIRERSTEKGEVDQNSFQRLYDPEKIKPDLQIKNAQLLADNKMHVEFSDNHNATYCLDKLITEITRSNVLPPKIYWDKNDAELKKFSFAYGANESQQLFEILKFYHEYGYVVVEDLPAKDGEVIKFAEKIGFIRETNFGKLFNVRSQKQPNDLAYTSIELESHTDNPYRKPVPSIQFLFCIENSCKGGDSTVVDGFKVAEDLKKENPQAFNILVNTLINYKFEDNDAILEKTGKIIKLSARGELKQIKYSNRLDFVFYDEPKVLEEFYAAKRVMHQMINSDKYILQFHLEPGNLLIMNNYRTLHGRRSYNTSEGSRWLQGLYIDHDSAESKYKLLSKEVE